MRKFILEYTKLDFEKAGQLWSSFKVVRAMGTYGANTVRADPITHDCQREFRFHIPDSLSDKSICQIHRLLADFLVCNSLDDIEKGLAFEIMSRESLFASIIKLTGRISRHFR